MKSKIGLMIVAAVALTTLVASAQQSPDNVASARFVPAPAVDPFAPAGTALVQPGLIVNPVDSSSPAGRGGLWGHSGDSTRDHALREADRLLARKTEVLARQLAEARTSAQRETIKGQLGKLLEEQFDQRQKRHEEEIKHLEAQIKKLKDLVDKRQENRGEIIGARLNQIVKEAEGLGW